MKNYLTKGWVVLLVILAAGVVTVTLNPDWNPAQGYLAAYSWSGILVLALIAWFCEYVDSTLGMGYGTTLTPLLLIAGFPTLDVVPAVLFSECLTGITAGLAHHQFGNVSFAKGGRPIKVAGLFALCSVVGTVAAVVIALKLPPWLLKAYIGLLILSMGILILAYRNGSLAFSWRRIVGLGVLASFNKGISGGGYGPIITGGQILSGLEEKNAVAITSLAEGVTCAVGLVLYVVLQGPLDWRLALPLAAGALASVPLAAWTVKIMPPQTIKSSIGYFTCFLGILTLIKLALGLGGSVG